MSLLKTGVKEVHHLKVARVFFLSGLKNDRFNYFSTGASPNSFNSNNNVEVSKELKKRIFNTVLWEQDPEVSFVRKKYFEIKERQAQLVRNVSGGVQSPRPIALRFLDENTDTNISLSKSAPNISDDQPIYPYVKALRNDSNLQSISTRRDKSHRARDEVVKKLEEKRKRMKKWMSDYDCYDESHQGYEASQADLNYGSSDCDVPVSKVPCGGCGALLHCQDHSIPGYLPKELFENRTTKELKTIKCQRCHFLKEFNVALDVSVSPEEYPKIISCIKDKRAIAVLMIDLLDFPCSIWPEIMDIIGTNRPVIIVGNKVDLIPGDHLGYMNHLKETLLVYVEKMGIHRANIKHVALVSAYSGFGVEDLITQLHDLWEYKSDVFLLGCTNVGKSSLFNKLLYSDFCKTQAINLIQRATTSIWPGTTLNLLKFPVLRPEGWRLAIRRKRLLSQANKLKLENALRKEQFGRHRMYHMPTFFHYVGRTFIQNKENTLDMYSINNDNTGPKGIDENDYDFAKGYWCYDTPGVMHPDQILSILTTEELMKVIPRAVIVPRFFSLKPGRSLFLAGLGRIDLLNASWENSARVAVFSSKHLPVSIVQTHEAEDVYNQLLGSELMAVPCGGPQRIAHWPGLQAKDEIIQVTGHGWKECCADIVLSSAGWVAISGGVNMEMSFRVWTPFSRGIHLRQPALLPYAINFRGKRIDHTPTYHTGRVDGKTETPVAQNHKS